MFNIFASQLSEFTCDSNLIWQVLAQAEGGAASTPSFFQSGWFGFLVFLAIVALAIFLGNTFARSIRLPEYGAKLSVILGTIAVALLLIAANNFTPKFGIDLRGGINMIGSLNLTPDAEDADPFSRTQTTAEKIIPILLRRVDPSGTREIMIRPLGTDKIEVTIPTNNKAEADEIWKRLVKTGKLQFLIMAESNFRKHNEARTMAQELAGKGNRSSRVGEVIKEIEGKEVKMPLARWFSLALEDDEGQKLIKYKMLPDGRQLVRDSRTGRIVPAQDIMSAISSRDEDVARGQFTNWWKKNFKGSPQVLLMEPETEEMRVEGKHLNAAALRIGMDDKGRDNVNFEMTADGAEKMFDFTWEHKPSSEGKYRMAIVLDKQIHSAPALQEAISQRGQINGNFSSKEVEDLIISLRSGNIDVALNDNPISSQFIESDLGQELKEKGLMAIGASFIIVLLFMIFYYRFAGIVAALALLLNLVFILALIMAIQQPLTLTGLAGLVLTVGMSVDANVLIFERIREELDKGAALRMAIRNGFDKATTTIVDANVTTLITAIVLYVIGTEQIKGFAVTLILGILMSMFTAIYCARAVFDIWERKRWITALGMQRMLSKTQINFISKRFIAGVLSVILIGIGIAAMFGLQDRILHHDLRGGSTVRTVFKAPPGGDDADGRQFVLDKLEAEKIEFKGEEIEFSVSKLSSDEFPDRVFKIDSNLPSYDGDGEAPYEELANLIARVFDGDLELLEVKIVGTVAGDNSSPTIGDSAPAPTDSGWLNSPSILSALTLHQPNVLLTRIQDEPSVEESTSADTGDSSPASQQDSTSQETASEDTTSQDDTVNSTTVEGNDFQDGSVAPKQAEAALGTVSTSSDLSFKFPVAGKELRTLILAAAENQDMELEADQITLQSPDATDETSMDSFMSTDWKVDLNLPERDSATVLNGFASTYNEKPYFPTISAVGGQIARDTQIQAMVAIIASLIGIIAYVWIRFQNVAFGLAAVVALIHDVLIVIGAIAISHYVAGALGFLLIENFKISLPIVAALLTIIGYSLNDTIVVFDRIREVRGKRIELNAEIVNTSISQTLSRTILTSLTTFIVVFILYCFGGDAIHGFAFSLVVGVIAGTYSSIFVASPVLLWLMNSVGLNPGDPIEDKPATA